MGGKRGNKKKQETETKPKQQWHEPKPKKAFPPKPIKAIKRTYEEEKNYLHKLSPTLYKIDVGFVPNMKVPAYVLVNDDLEVLLLDELKRAHDSSSGSSAGFLPALKQVANVAALPGIVKGSFAMPDVHSGYGFCIGNVAAFDVDDPNAVVSPGGVGFDINCGVRLIRTNLTEKDLPPLEREKLAQALFDHIPVGVGQKGIIPLDNKELDEVLLLGIDYCIKQGYSWPEDREHCEENGRMLLADPSQVTKRAKKRGITQLGTLGAGNHYVEVQVVDEVYDEVAAARMGLSTGIGQVCVMIHSGSRGLGHQVATDSLVEMETAMARDGIQLNDRQLSCARINSPEGKKYLAAMSCAANYAWANRSCLTYLVRKAFEKTFQKNAYDLDMHIVYDVSHNIAKIEKHSIPICEPVNNNSLSSKSNNKKNNNTTTKSSTNITPMVVDVSNNNNDNIGGDDCCSDDNECVTKTLLVHRKGSTRAFPPHHPLIPVSYQLTGQPVLIGGTMGTCSYVLTGTQQGMVDTFGSTCHGAGRALSRNASRRKLDHIHVLDDLKKKGIAIRVASPKLVTEEAPESYKDVINVVNTCQEAGISRKAVKLRPIAVVKG